MAEKNKNLKEDKPKEGTSPLSKLKKEWSICVWGFLRPFAVIPLLLTIASLWVANIEGINKNVSLLLQIIATILGGVALSFFYDVIRNTFESSLLVKKGVSAIRNLALARLKINRISDREKEKASSEEVINLLSLLEKDIANATQEWNDILPGVDKIEMAYNLLDERERELQVAKKSKEELTNQVRDAKKLGEKEQAELKEKLDKKEDKINRLEKQISKLRQETDPITITGASGLLATGPSGPDLSFMAQMCSRCNNAYYPNPLYSNDGICDNCKTYPHNTAS